MPRAELTQLDVLAEARWDFRGGQPSWAEPSSGHPIATFDPFPCYPHDPAAARWVVEHAAGVWPLPWDLTVYLADREDAGRTNGFSHLHEGGRYDGDDWVKAPPAGIVVLSGKRIPPHPAVTRYLVGHEYGHHAEWSLNHMAGAKRLCAGDAARDYLKLRGLDASADYHGDGGRWHTSVHEIMACDFRILVCGIEPDFWPHPGIAQPAEVRGLAGWWEDQRQRALDAQKARP